MTDFYWIACAVSNTPGDVENTQQLDTFVLASYGTPRCLL